MGKENDGPTKRDLDGARTENTDKKAKVMRISKEEKTVVNLSIDGMEIGQDGTSAT